MKMTNLRKILSFCLLTVLIAAMALTSTGCTDKETPKPAESTAASTAASAETPAPSTAVSAETKVLGEGSKVFDFKVTDFEGKETDFEIHTDKETVGEALQELGLLEGEEGAFGLYVKTVNGITADFDKDGKYWAFYIDGEYATTGVDTTKIEDGKTYELKVE